MAEVACPTCGEDEELVGQRTDDGLVITCESCATTFDRDLTPRCSVCGSSELVATATNLLEDSGRGDMTTPTGIVQRYVCWSCGAEDATSPDAVAATGDWRGRRGDLDLTRHLRTRD